MQPDQKNEIASLEDQLATAQARVKSYQDAIRPFTNDEEISCDTVTGVCTRLTARCTKLEEALKNCHMMARRITASGKFSIEKMGHIVRFCEDAGVSSKGILRDQALPSAAEKEGDVPLR